MTPSQTDPEREIASILERWAASVRMGRGEEILADVAPEALIFDVLAPFQHDGRDAYRASWAEWEPPFEIPSVFELEDVRITASAETAFASATIRCGGTLPGGRQVEDRVRTTVCFKRKPEGWQIVHRHTSMPRTAGQ